MNEEEMKLQEQFESHEYGVIYLDILGQKELMEKLEQKKASSEEKQQMQNVLRHIKKLMEELKCFQCPGVGVQQFSDATMIYVRLDDITLDVENLFVRLVCALPNILFMALREGVLMRGAVAKGMAWEIKPNCLYGPVIRDAYDLEAKVAQWSRVVVSNKVVSLFKEHLCKRKGVVSNENDCSIQLLESIFVRGQDGVTQITLFPTAVLAINSEKDEDKEHPQRTLDKFFELRLKISNEIECKLGELASMNVTIGNMNKYSKFILRKKVFLQEIMNGIVLFAQFCKNKGTITDEEYESIIKKVKNSKYDMGVFTSLPSYLE